MENGGCSWGQWRLIWIKTFFLVRNRPYQILVIYKRFFRVDIWPQNRHFLLFLYLGITLYKIPKLSSFYCILLGILSSPSQPSNVVLCNQAGKRGKSFSFFAIKMRSSYIIDAYNSWSIFSATIEVVVAHSFLHKRRSYAAPF